MFSHPTNGEASMEKVSIIGLDLSVVRVFETANWLK
jgi:hypothetical protein